MATFEFASPIFATDAPRGLNHVRAMEYGPHRERTTIKLARFAGEQWRAGQETLHVGARFARQIGERALHATLQIGYETGVYAAERATTWAGKLKKLGGTALNNVMRVGFSGNHAFAKTEAGPAFYQGAHAQQTEVVPEFYQPEDASIVPGFEADEPLADIVNLDDYRRPQTEVDDLTEAAMAEAQTVAFPRIVDPLADTQELPKVA